MATPTITTLAPWFGSNRLLASKVGAQLSDCQWVGIPFLGGGSELAHIFAPSIVANDLHKQVINMAKIIADSKLGAKLFRELRRLPYHGDVLREAQEQCRVIELSGINDPYEAAKSYFICCWMNRSSVSGQASEFDRNVPIRWERNGGEGPVRFASAVESLKAWRKILTRVTFCNLDCFYFLSKCKDADGYGIYCDPPFPEVGLQYRHSFTVEQQRRLATTLSKFKRTKVVCRFYQHPLIEELYPRSVWKWSELESRRQNNVNAAEVLLVNREYNLFGKI